MSKATKLQLTFLFIGLNRCFFRCVCEGVGGQQNNECFLSPDPKRIGGYSDQPGVRPSVRLSVRRQKLVHSITFIPFEIF